MTRAKWALVDRPMTFLDKIVRGTHAVIESVVDLLKNILQIEHSRRGSVVNYFVNLLTGLIV